MEVLDSSISLWILNFQQFFYLFFFLNTIFINDINFWTSNYILKYKKIIGIRQKIKKEMIAYKWTETIIILVWKYILINENIKTDFSSLIREEIFWLIRLENWE